MAQVTVLQPSRALLAKVAVAAAAGACVLIAIGAAGSGDQWSEVPFLIGVAVIVCAIVFGLLVPRGLHAIETGTPTATRWIVGHGVASVILLGVFWTGAELIVGTAAILLAVTGRRRIAASGSRYRLTLWLAGSAMVLSVAWTVLNTAVLGN